MAKGATFKVVDKYAKRMQREARAKQPSLKVGVTQRTANLPHPKSDKPVGDIAFFNEFGTMTIPARSFIRDWVDGNIDNITKQLGTDTLRVLMTSEKMRDALTKRGKQYREAIVRRIERRIPPPNAPSTLAQKVGDIPLIDTETLIDAITYEVK
jgi:hypothetical protein